MILLTTMVRNEKMSRVFQDLVHAKLRDEGKNKTEVAADLGVSAQTLSSYLSGKHEPSTGKLKAYADYFGVSIDCLLGEDKPAAADAKTTQKSDSDLDQLPLTKLERDIIRMLRANENDTALQNFLFKLIEGAANAGNGQDGGAD